MNNRKKSGDKNSGTILLVLMIVCFLYFSFSFSGCNFNNTPEEPVETWDSLTVTASAFNSTRAQTGTGNPNITAWGDTIAPGMKILAVSRDLIARGLDHNTEVIIEGMDGVFTVKDKMHNRWKNKIDIYMGENIEQARQFGRKKVRIFYKVKQDSIDVNPL